MDPRLEGIAGALKGEIYPLHEDSVSLGSSADNHIYVGDSLVSPKHCLIEKKTEQYMIRDLDSENGTYVNELPVKQRLLEQGDRIILGNSLFVFVTDEDQYALLAQYYQEAEYGLIGESPRMKEIHRSVLRVGPTNSTVLVRGESGTGKELLAHAIHLNSPRKNLPFVAINCAALSGQLLESELFGHEKGSFTGAFARKKGKLEFAEGGTVFLDEVGELEPELQAKLLRMLETLEFERVGGIRPIRINIRLLAATNSNLEEAIEAGTFRADLYYRLAVVILTMPPLRECREDIPILTSNFIARCCKRSGRRIMGISSEARAMMMQYDWPGNVRELQNALEHAVVLGEEDVIQPGDLPRSVSESGRKAPEAIPDYRESIKSLKKKLILQAVRQAEGNRTLAAKALGLHPNHLHRLIRNLHLEV